MHVLRVDSSARTDGSVTRALTDRLMSGLAPEAAITTRDVSSGFPVVDSAWVTANFTDAGQRTAEQQAILAQSEMLVAELEAADLIVIGLPVYNFGIPASMKTWIDLVVRARRTFRYTESGPVGLLTGKRAIIVYASGGTAQGSGIDFASSYLRHILGFIGITDVTVVAADRTMSDGDAIGRAEDAIDALVATLRE